MSEQTPRFRTFCGCCEFIYCIEPKNGEIGKREIVNIDADKVVISEAILECPVLHGKERPGYMLWMLGWLNRYCGPIRVIEGDEL